MLVDVETSDCSVRAEHELLSGREVDDGELRAGHPLPAGSDGWLARILGRPARSIRSRAQAMRAGPRFGEAPAYTAFAEDIVKASRHLEFVAGNLGGPAPSASRSGGGSFRIAALLEESLRLTRPAAAARNIQISCTASGAELPPVAGSPHVVQQIVLNLLSNAVKFSAPGTVIEVAARGSGDTVRLQVADSGPGVREEDRERIFERFERLQPEAEGMGLGLAISRRYAEEMNGRLYVEDRGDGEEGGATFVLELLFL